LQRRIDEKRNGDRVEFSAICVAESWKTLIDLQLAKREHVLKDATWVEAIFNTAITPSIAELGLLLRAPLGDRRPTLD
jgi:hypothetical protein